MIFFNQPNIEIVFMGTLASTLKSKRPHCQSSVNPVCATEPVLSSRQPYGLCSSHAAHAGSDEFHNSDGCSRQLPTL